MTVHVDVLVATTGRPCLAAAERSAERALLASDDITLHLQVVHDSDRRGPAWARNRAVEQGSAEFLALLDDDDLWLPGRLSRALEVLRERPEVALVCGEALPLEGGLFLAADPLGSGRPATIEPGDHSHADLAADCFVAASSVTLRRADWDRAGGMPESFRQAEDYALWLQLTRGGRPVHVLPDALCRLGTDGVRGASAEPGSAAATLAALEEYAEPSAVQAARRGPLLAVMAMDARRSGDRGAARNLARRALNSAPDRSLSWKAALRALI
ncbi:MAG: glycosyltransferase [Deltaproteobacteria bacterium]|nr:glycosyltransferase [Deltaproteobacteria bacterium]